MIEFSQPIIHSSSTFEPKMYSNQNYQSFNQNNQNSNQVEFIKTLTKYLYLKNKVIPEIRKFKVDNYDVNIMPASNLCMYISTLAPAKMQEFEFNLMNTKLDESCDFQFLQTVEKNTIIFTPSMDSEMLQKIVKNSRNTEELNIKWSTASIVDNLDFSIDSVYKIRMLTLYFYSQSINYGYGNIPYNAIKCPLLLVCLQNQI